MTEKLLERLEELLAKAPARPWEVETEHDPDAEYGSGPDPDRGFDDFIVFDAIGQLLFGTATSDAKCIVEEPYGDEDGYKQAWDETGKATADLTVAAVNELPALIATIRKLQAENERLREGLRPFAEDGDLYESHVPDDLVPTIYCEERGTKSPAYFTVGDLRNARTLITPATCKWCGGRFWYTSYSGGVAHERPCDHCNADGHRSLLTTPEGEG